MKIDQTNIDIIKELKQGKKSFKRIADKLAITENTVRSRVNKLQEEGVLEICGLVDPAMLPGHRVVIIGIKLSEMDLVEKGREISRLKGVIHTNVVTGRFDLLIMVLFKKGSDCWNFTPRKLPKSKVSGPWKLLLYINHII